MTHRFASSLLDDARRGLISRRGFLTRASALGLICAVPRHASGAPVQGGTLRVQQILRPLKDPRTFDWSELANFCRGWLEYLVAYLPDGRLEGRLLTGWSANENATRYTLRLRRGVRWNTGEPFTAAHVAANFARWCDGAAPGNSMAGRLIALIDPRTGQLAEGAIEVLDDFTLELRLGAPDATLIASLADYPAAVVHPSYDGGDPSEAPIGTGPFLPEPGYSPGVRGALVRNTNHSWWGSDLTGGPWLDRIEFIDFGTDPRTTALAFEADEIDMNYQSLGTFSDELDRMGLTRTGVETSATYVIRARASATIDGVQPYADTRLRKALALGVDNGVCLELGYGNRGTVAANHHVSALQPDFADIGEHAADPAQARALAAETGLAGMTHVLLSLDDDWQSATCDAVAAQLNDAGFRVERGLLPAEEFAAEWREHPFSGTEWNMRPLGVQSLALAYRSTSAWNETGFADPAFDADLNAALAEPDAIARQAIMARLQQRLVDEGVIIQPYWRKLFRHAKPGILGAGMHPMFEIDPAALAFEG